jgi:cobalt-zinc-cadmium efflux system outer membrane protein
MARFLVLAVCMLVLIGVAARASAQDRFARLTLDQAVELALRENAALRAKGFEVESTRAGEITAGLIPNPTASYTSEKYGASSNVFIEHTATLGQPIELGGKRQRRLDSARAQTRVTQAELQDARRQVVFQVKKAFTDALAARAGLALAEQNLKALEDVERLQRLRAEKGDISELELLRLQVQTYQFQRDAADARQAATAAKVALRAVAGPERIADDFEVEGELGFRDLAPSRSELYRMTLDNRPDIRVAEAAREKARADVNLARANAWWDVTPQLEYKRTDANEQTFGFGFSVPIRIFDRNQGEIARTRAEVNRVDAVRQAVAVQALAEVDTALGALVTERQKLMLLRDTYLPKAQQARDTVEFAYRRGGVSLLDFLDAQRTYRETSLEYLRALANYWTALYLLETAVGGSLGN